MTIATQARTAILPTHSIAELRQRLADCRELMSETSDPELRRGLVSMERTTLRKLAEMEG